MISVVIPLYNKAHTIINTLNSVLNQIYQDFEIIIINDGSTDNSVKIINQTFSDTRIKIINQNNLGVSAARNRGVDESKGNYIAFLDGDDQWHPSYLSTMHELILKYPKAGLFLCGGLISNNKNIYYRIAPKYEGYKGPINLFENPEVFSHTSATIVHKDTFNQTHRFLDGMEKFEDYLASQAIALISETIYCGLPLTKYMGGIPGQLTQQNRNNPNIANSEILYFNTIMEDYSHTHKKNTLCPIFIRYFLRHLFKTMIKNHDFNKTIYILNHLSNNVRELLSPIDSFLIKHHLRHLIIIWINITKVKWRSYGFPIVGQTIDIYKIKKNLLNW